IEISREEWNHRETAWDFKQNDLLRIKEIEDLELEKAYDLFKLYWTNKFFELHRNEERLNRDFITLYGLEEELTPDVVLKDITLLTTEVDQKRLEKISHSYKSGWELKDGKWVIEQREQPALPFDTKEVITQFMSYAVGCIFGRYSLDRGGLI